MPRQARTPHRRHQHGLEQHQGQRLPGVPVAGAHGAHDGIDDEGAHVRDARRQDAGRERA